MRRGRGRGSISLCAIDNIMREGKRSRSHVNKKQDLSTSQGLEDLSASMQAIDEGASDDEMMETAII